ncbi:ribonuclease HII [Sediminibacillus massiliensis]|uniref:ribonuclease HII n=1 Tax=Sediminibacillus massiliensis TaxID=1926277 RepID=UPI00098875B8|nr:ribonuclease HII [Sediminibacillus massiliensis]
MKDLTITQVKEIIKKESFSEEWLDGLRNDSRKGVQRLILEYERKQENLQKQKDLFEQMKTFEKEQYCKGVRLVAGIDEAGRGPLAGPVVAAAVILEESFFLPGLNDSKKLSYSIREEFYRRIVAEAVTYGVGIVHSHEIDQMNIYRAAQKAMLSAVNQLDPVPEHILIDAMPLEMASASTESIIKGDQRSISIAAASIVAKVTRDRMMEEFHQEYPYYQFNKNMGYGTQTHIQAIKDYGVSPYHRRTFAPVKDYI